MLNIREKIQKLVCTLTSTLINIKSMKHFNAFKFHTFARDVFLIFFLFFLRQQKASDFFFLEFNPRQRDRYNVFWDFGFLCWHWI